MSKPTLTLADFQAAADSIGVDVPAIQAVTDVESRGRGFLPDDRPVILYERHVMYRQLIAEAGLGEAVHFATTQPDIVNRNPGGYKGGAIEWDRLAAAIKIDRSCALQSASWGMFQIMGFHWSRLRYANVQAFVNAMYAGEAEHLDAFCRLVRADSAMQRALLMHDWAKFARIYNGPDFAKNAYDTKLAQAYAKRTKELQP